MRKLIKLQPSSQNALSLIRLGCVFIFKNKEWSSLVMYKRRLHQNKLLNKFIVALSLASMTNCSLALSTDKQQDIQIEADSAEMDDMKGITIYRGNVVVDQGSIHMTGHTMTVYNDDNDETELVIMEGQPATYRQLPEDSKIYDEAEALQMEYYALKDYVILIDKALVTQEGLRFSGSRIEYDTVLSQVKAKGSNKKSKLRDGGDKKNSDGRVKITIKKNKK
jgi:lipopolysaccharide export system protein LptA